MASNKEKEYNGLTRSLRILRTVVESPYFYTKKKLAERYEVNESSITRDFRAFENVGFELHFDERYRYALSAEKKYEHLKNLLVFSTKEEEILTTALQKLGLNNTTIENLQKKLSRIYDASKMHNTFDKNFLTKMDKLEKARTEKKAIRHFRISRTTKVELTSQSWLHENMHNIVATDPFRIQDNKQVKVHLRLKVGAYNEILERFPLCRGFLKPSPEGGEGLYDLECKVNHKLYGLSNFVLGYYGEIVSIIEPESLIEHVREAAKKILKE